MRSILYKNEANIASKLEESLFTDLKITKFLEFVFDNYSDVTEITETLQNVPSKEDLIYRQEIFTDILSDKENLLDNLYYDLVKLVGRYNSYRQAAENIKRRIFFVFYEHYFYLFLEKVVKVINDINAKSTGLLDISKDINTYLEKADIKKRRESVDKIYEAIATRLKFNLEYHDGAPYYQVTFNEQSNLEDNLKNLIDKLGISYIKAPKSVAKHEINPYFLREISLNDPKVFVELTNLHEKYRNGCVDLTDYVKELKYYLSLKIIFNKVNSLGVPFNKGEIIDTNDTVINDCYDISLLVSGITVIPNDYHANNTEFIDFVLGVNSGGKTCYLRSVAINYVLFMTCGWGFFKSAKIYPVKYIHTHFPNEENYAIGEGRLRDEIKRLDRIKQTFGPDSIAFLNETFSSTSEDRACKLTYELLDSIGDTKAKVMYVTHQYKIFEELQDDSRIVFLTPVVIEGEENVRTHKIKRVDKKLLSYVNDILFKHGLTKKQLLQKRANVGGDNNE